MPLSVLQGVSSALITGSGLRTWILDVPLPVDYAWNDRDSAESAGQLNNMVKHEPSPRANLTPYINLICPLLYFNRKVRYPNVLNDNV